MQVESTPSFLQRMKSAYVAGKKDYIQKRASEITGVEELDKKSEIPSEFQQDPTKITPAKTEAQTTFNEPLAGNSSSPSQLQGKQSGNFFATLSRVPFSVWAGIACIIKGVVIGKRDFTWVGFGPGGTSLPLETYVIDIPFTVIGFMSLLIGLAVMIKRNQNG